MAERHIKMSTLVAHAHLNPLLHPTQYFSGCQCFLMSYSIEDLDLFENITIFRFRQSIMQLIVSFIRNLSHLDLQVEDPLRRMPVPSLDCFWSFSVLLLPLPTFPYHTTHDYSVTWSSTHLCAKNWMWSNVAEISSLISTSSAWYTSFGFGYCTLGSIYIQLTFVIVKK